MTDVLSEHLAHARAENEKLRAQNAGLREAARNLLELVGKLSPSTRDMPAVKRLRALIRG